MTVTHSQPARPAVRSHEIALVDLLDRLLATGVVVAGEVTLSIAEVDLVNVSLRALVCSVRAPEASGGAGAGDSGTRHD